MLPLSSPPAATSASPSAHTIAADTASLAVHVMCYSPSAVVEHHDILITEVPQLLEHWPVVWIDIENHNNPALLEAFGNLFGLHRLVLEDIANVHHRPKYESYEDYLFLLLKMGRDTEDFETEQLSIVLKNNVVLTFQQNQPGDCFGDIRDRIRHGKGKIRHRNADYLCYRIVDAVLESYFPVLEKINFALEAIEGEILTKPDQGTIADIHHTKTDLLMLHRAVWPMRDITNQLMRDEDEFFAESTHAYLRDCHDQAVYIAELSGFYREVSADLMNTLLAYSNHKMNEVIKVLTLISSIFIPLGFVAGVYGMNFDGNASPLNMPELHWHYGYPAVLLFMLSIGLGLVALFKKKGWV